MNLEIWVVTDKFHGFLPTKAAATNIVAVFQTEEEAQEFVTKGAKPYGSASTWYNVNKLTIENSLVV